MAHDVDDLYRMRKGAGFADGYDPPEYPGGLCCYMRSEDLEKIGGDKTPGATFRFSAMAEVTSITRSLEGCRIELEVCHMAADDGKFFELDRPCHLCLSESELTKMDLSDDCERGDMIHLIGEARLDSHTDGQFDESCCLQITHLNFEDESAEVRGGG